MTMIMSSTMEQEEKIKSLSAYLSQHVFPQYIDLSIANAMKEEGIFHIDDESLKYVESLDDASQVITALNTIISILEASYVPSSYKKMFKENIDILRRYQIIFPFPISFFFERKSPVFL